MFWGGILITYVLILLDYCSDFGHFLIETACCLLCVFFFPVLCKTNDSTTQTDNAVEEETALQEAKYSNHMLSHDEPDAQKPSHKPLNTTQYPNVQRSLQRFFECAYSQLVMPWYNTPENRESQPLHEALLGEYNLIADKIICKAKNFDLSITSVGWINIVTQHLRYAKQSNGCPAFSSPVDEMAVIRVISNALVKNLFPEDLWKAQVYCCALQEILALRVLALVALLSDPNNFNSLVVSQLGQTSSESSVVKVHEPDRESTTSVESKETEMVKTKEEDLPAQEVVQKQKDKKSNVVANIFAIFEKKKKKKKMKKETKNQMLCLSGSPPRRVAAIETDSDSCSEDSRGYTIESDVEDNESKMEEEEEEMKFKLSYEMWKIGNWTISVTYAEEMRNEFTFCVQEKDNPENLCWEVKKTWLEIADFHEHFKDITRLPRISAIEGYTEAELNEEDQENARKTLEDFFKDLVSDKEYGHSELVFKFLSPLHQLLKKKDQVEGVWGLLRGLASFLVPEQDDEEINTLKEVETADETLSKDSLSDHDDPQPSYAYSMDNCLVTLDSSSLSDYTSKSEKPKESGDDFSAVSELLSARGTKIAASAESDDDNHITPAEPSSKKEFKKEKLKQKQLPETEKPKGKEKVYLAQRRPVQEKMFDLSKRPDITKAILDLMEEIYGNSGMFKFMKALTKIFMPIIRRKVTAIFKKINPSEAQVAKQIDSLCERIWPEGEVPQELPQNAEENKKKALHLIISNSYAIFKKGGVEDAFNILQNQEENKKLVYMLLFHLLREFLPEEQAFKIYFKWPHVHEFRDFCGNK